ncbi:DsbA family protein [Candidatus Nitrotoga arctica]|uniref:DsbA family protein n=1 Tax=Candidatus Nitrotoga arctica TaxID=453162 RepID=UPI001EFC2BC0|nr:thioredoxin domain-containing protein [Candidatus Nitrotoga arctica]
MADPPVDGGRDHCLGETGADITLVEYGSLDCPYCRGAHEVVASLRDRFGDRMRYVFRHRSIMGDDIAREGADFAEYAHQSRLVLGGPRRADETRSSARAGTFRRHGGAARSASARGTRR